MYRRMPTGLSPEIVYFNTLPDAKEDMFVKVCNDRTFVFSIILNVRRMQERYNLTLRHPVLPSILCPKFRCQTGVKPSFVIFDIWAL